MLHLCLLFLDWKSYYNLVYLGIGIMNRSTSSNRAFFTPKSFVINNWSDTKRVWDERWDITIQTLLINLCFCLFFWWIIVRHTLDLRIVIDLYCRVYSILSFVHIEDLTGHGNYWTCNKNVGIKFSV